MKPRRIFSLSFTALLLLLLFALVLCACGTDVDELIISSDTYSIAPGETFSIEEFKKIYLTDTTETEPIEADTTEFQNENGASVIPEDDVVYWVSGGEVWHATRSCSSLSRSKTVLSGTPDEALAAGKIRECKRCGN